MEKTIRFALFLFLATGMLFAGCDREEPVENETSESVEFEDYNGTLETNTESTTTTPATDASSQQGTTTQTPTQTPVETPAQTSTYKDGTYSKSMSYSVPEGSASIGVTLVIKNDIVESVSIDNQAKDSTSKAYIQAFSQKISGLVVGKSLADISNLSAVSGASLTTKAFDKAVQALMTEAQA